jgi:sulfide:quinone oxidoreductase
LPCLYQLFSGQGIKAYNSKNEDITSELFAPNGFMKVDADYTPKPFEAWSINDWPENYQNPVFKNTYMLPALHLPRLMLYQNP